MCHQINYTLPCEHVKTEIIYCADAPPPPPVVSSSSPSENKGGHGHGHGHGHSSSSTSSSKKGTKHAKGSSSSSSSGTKGESSKKETPRRKPCKNLTQQSLPYPTPPSFAGSPSTAAASLLSPKCPLPRCPFEEKNRCWNCCWCGKGWNERGRCSCVMLINGHLVQCEHICCDNCEAAAAAG